MTKFRLFLVLSCIHAVFALKTVIIGASGGVGQQICSSLLQNRVEVTSISRNIKKLQSYPLLDGSKKLELSTTDTKTLASVFEACDSLVISVGTTAFPTKAWDNNNTPKVACYDSVVDIMTAVKATKKRPKRIVLITSIGVERANDFPFKILNSYGVLTEKKKSEEYLIANTLPLGITPIICRPGRLIGEPFTNFDLAKLLKIQPKETTANILVDTSDTLKGDVSRKDVAISISKLLLWKNLPAKKALIYSIINTRGPTPSDKEWEEKLQSIIV